MARRLRLNRIEPAPVHAAPFPFSVVLQPVGDRLVVGVLGEIDPATALSIDGAVDCAIHDGWNHIAIDLRRVTFMDSAGVHLLKRLRARTWSGTRIEMVGTCPEVERALFLAELSDCAAARRAWSADALGVRGTRPGSTAFAGSPAVGLMSGTGVAPGPAAGWRISDLNRGHHDLRHRPVRTVGRRTMRSGWLCDGSDVERIGPMLPDRARYGHWFGQRRRAFRGQRAYDGNTTGEMGPNDRPSPGPTSNPSHSGLQLRFTGDE